MTTALTTKEAKDLQSLTVVISEGLATFIEVGRALLEIRERRLWREGWDSFDSWCRDVHGFSQSYASRLITASKQADDLPTAQKPTTERQARKAREEAKPAERTQDSTDASDGTEQPARGRTDATTRQEAAGQERSGLGMDASTDAEPASAAEKFEAWIIERIKAYLEMANEPPHDVVIEGVLTKIAENHLWRE